MDWANIPYFDIGFLGPKVKHNCHTL